MLEGLALLLQVTVPQQIAPLWMPFLPFAALGLFLSILIVVSYYMLASLLNSAELTAYAKEELSATIMSATIVGMWLALMGIFASLASAITVGIAVPRTAHIDYAFLSLDILKNKLISVYSGFYFYEILIGFYSTISFSINWGIPVLLNKWFSLVPYAGLSILSNAHTMIVEWVGYTIMLVIARGLLLEFIRDATPLFFGFAIVLRAFPFTRRTGSSLLAFCAAGFFIYPLAVLFTNYLLFSPDLYGSHYADFSQVPSSYSMCNDPDSIKEMMDVSQGKNDELNDLFSQSSTVEKEQPYYTKTWEYTKDVTTGLSGFLSKVAKFIMRFFSDLFLKGLNGAHIGSLSFLFFHYIIEEVQNGMQLVVLTYVSFVIEIIITITMYRNISFVLGGELEIPGISKLI